MKKYLTSGLILALALGFFSCDKQGGKHPSPSKRGGHQHERQHPRRSMLSQQAEQSSDEQQQEVTQQ
ncbi:hypothetical protein COB11_01195 [Candidatus Aerophobetes bacterium]|uniref:Lipoprotein n=1 Tax=Aerophobetes bacterium TaxID=2030807 RepID=A0A2A4YLQ6_UNCAE|nr:MAG: hypothetical protein COB11_01195 [Candidatus Aerophobetes bacterium]